MNAVLEYINSAGKGFVEFTLPMLVQSSVLIAVLLLADLVLRRKVRAVFRYWLWMLVLAKLILPTSLSSPVSVGHLVGNELQSVKISMPQNATAPLATEAVSVETVNREITMPQTSAIEPAAVQPKIIATPVTWQGVVFLIWLAVVMVMGLLLLQRAIFVCGLVAQAKEANSSMNDTLKSCCGQMKMKRTIGLKVSANAVSPAVCGLFRPVILVPENLGSSLGAGHLRTVLLHELSHIKRGDLWVNLVQTILQIVYFYNPLLWLANAVIRRIREQAVDEMVLVAIGDNAHQYPQTLVDVAKLAFRRPALSLRLIGVVESKSALAGRIKHILNRPIPKSAKLGMLGLAVIVFIGCVLLPMAKAAVGQPEFVIKGTVTDAETGQPIAGAKVGDVERYAEGKQWTTTDPNGNYSYKTWYEEHNVVARIKGYLPQEKIVKTKLMGHEKERILDFELSPEKSDKRTQFKTALPNGVTVELVGICEHPSKGKKWWRPDGGLLEQKPWEKINGSVSDGWGAKSYEFAFKLVHPEGFVPGWYIVFEDSGSMASGGYESSQTGQTSWFAVALPSDKKDIDITVALATGKWKTRFSREVTPGTGVSAEGSNEGGVAWFSPVESDGKTSIVVSHSFRDFQTRVVAIDKEGVEHSGEYSSGTFKAESDTVTLQAFFKLPLGQIREFSLQTRPYEKYVFKNVSLKPNFKTDVQIETENPAGQGEGNKKQLSFRPVIERVVNDDNEKINMFIDLDNGELITPPDELHKLNAAEQLGWFAQQGIDAGCETNQDVRGLFCVDMVAIPVSNDTWDTKSAESLYKDEILQQAKPGTLAFMGGKSDLPITYKFKTRENGIGILQIVDFTDNPKGVKIQYKIVEGTGSENPDVQVEGTAQPMEKAAKLEKVDQRQAGKSKAPARSAMPRVVSTTPAAFADDVSPDVNKITVTFDQPMMDQSWSWTGGGETYPQTPGRPYYDSSRTTCTLPVKLEAGKVYWVGINSPSYRNFKSADGAAAKRYVILFATRGADGKPTGIPQDLLDKAKRINEAPEEKSSGAKDVDVERRRARLRAAFEKRMARDKATYSDRELSEIEELYQVANKKWQSQEARDSLEKLIAKYSKANRTGCAVLYLGQMSDGAQKERYLKRALEDFSNCMYGDGVRVGAFARYLLAMHYEEIDKKDEAKRLIAELIKGYPDAIGHDGKLLIEQIPDDLKTDSESEQEDENKKETYIIAFQPIGSFQPQTAKELLDAFNSIVNFKVTTHHFRTMVQDGKLFGHILTDSKEGAKDIATMLEESKKLMWIHYREATQKDLLRHYAMGQPGLKDIDIRLSDFDIRSDEKRGVYNLVVSIQSDSNTTIPKFKLKFYQGDPNKNLDEAGNVHSGWHEAGPIEPGKSWNECTRDFHLPDGQYEFNAVLYFGESVININSGCAALKVKVRDGKIIEKSVDLNPLNKQTGQVEKKTDQQGNKQVVEQAPKGQAEPTVLASEFVGLLVKEDFSAATETFDATMKAVMPPEALANAWKGLLGQNGAFKKELGTRMEKLAGLDIVYVTCEFEKGPLDIKVVYNSKRQISGLWFVPVPQEILKGYQNKQKTPGA